MKNPLLKRLPRELKSELGKYLVIFLLMTASIGFISGFLVADTSMIAAYDESFSRYDVEDGHFETVKAMNRAQHKRVSALGISVYELFFSDLSMENGSTLRVFTQREAVNRACLMDGRFPEKPGEIAIDRMYAQNNGLAPGDRISGGGFSWQITGLVALSDYSALFSDNSDSMFDALKFGVSVVTAEDFAALDRDGLRNVYAWRYDDPPANEQEAYERSEELVKALAAEVKLKEYVPRYVNQAITFTGDDLGGDRAMMITLLYIIIVIMAFVLAVTVSNTIVKEAAVIGTLRASGYTRYELIRHYMAMPVTVTVISAVLGNILGYTVMKDVTVELYYNSYSLPSYVTLWNGSAFLLTTVVPLVLMVLINFFMLRSRLSLPPLKFLRRDLSKRRGRRGFRLSPRLPFFSRFRLRVILQNASSYLVLFVGVVFADLLLLFGMGLPVVLDLYQANISDNLLAERQYMLSLPLDALDEEHKLKSTIGMLQFATAVDTDTPGAEKFSAFTLKTTDRRYMLEDVVLYGVEPESRYVPLEEGGGAWISSAFAEKDLVSPGDTILLKEPYGDKTYSFTIQGIYPYGGSMALFMDRAALNRIMGENESYFCGYFSDEEIRDIDEAYIGAVISLEDLTKISRQLNISFGGMMDLVNVFSTLIFLVLIYLLSKIIIEKNAQAISMTKILGYSDREIGRLYLTPTTIVVILCILASLPIVDRIMYWLFRLVMMQRMPGWIPYRVTAVTFVKMTLVGIAAYSVVALLEYRRIRRIPMNNALKNTE